MHLISVTRALGTYHFHVHCVLYKLANFKSLMLYGRHIGFYADKEWSYMTDCHLVVFLDNENLGIDSKIGFLSGMVPKLLDIKYFCNYANLC